MIRLHLSITLFSLFLLVACGPELLLLFIPAISATWCEEGAPCHKFQIWPDTASNKFDHQGVISGREFFINPVNSRIYKDPSFYEEGENTLLGTFENLNVNLIIHKRTALIEENELVGAMEISKNEDQSIADRMVLESVTNGNLLILTRREGECNCQ